jgi:hypothetical protein
MQDAAAFYRNRVRSSFNRRRKYPVKSHEWKQAVEEVWQFIRSYRAQPREIRTGANLIAALQSSPCRDIEIEPERYHSDLARVDRMKDEV